MPEASSAKLGRKSTYNFVDWHVAILFLAGILALFSRFFRHDTFGFFEDDFFYYVQTASNFALRGISSFDGIHLSNGYHPLWMLLLTGLLRLTSGTAFLVAVQVVTLVAIFAFYFALVNLLDSVALDFKFRRLAALLLSLHALLLFRYGMEVTLSLPLGIATLAYVLRPAFRWTATQTTLYGLLACLTVLGRLDSLLLFILIVAAQTLASDSAWPLRLRRIGFFAVGFSPFLLYLAINEHFFGTLLPVSAAAKEMKPLFPLSLAPLLGLFLPMDRMKMAFVLPAVLLLPAGLFKLFRAWRSLRRDRRAILLALLLFPIVHIGVLCLLSDWGMWPWYYYPLVYSTLATIILLLPPSESPSRHTPPRVVRLALTVPILFYMVYFSIYAVKKQPSSIALIARDLATYMQSHPARYAMGDEAGTTSYLSGQPIIQLEGLMMDKAFLQNIRQQRPLAAVLHNYGIRYYIVLYAQPSNGCYTVHEPTNGGDESPHMSGRICQPPLFTATHSGSTASIFDANAVR
ncbi:hypothetical protein P8936_12540 [Edaphobacter paludis]|uniref:Glycosyltransferase RgtA/B/C/D-like domain-containing protein n=1 Tax=Edaphobacter paludis TaxID=3035702 RepID=A0AAU7CWF9_9BACT